MLSKGETKDEEETMHRGQKHESAFESQIP